MPLAPVSGSAGVPESTRIFGVRFQVGADRVQLVDHQLVDGVLDLRAVKLDVEPVIELGDLQGLRNRKASKRSAIA